MSEPIVLAPESVDAIADAIVARLRGSGSSQKLVDAATLADLLGVSRDTVYARADEFGAIRIGSGPRPRLRFNPARIAALPSEQTPPPPAPVRRPHRRRSGTDVELLPVGHRRRDGS